MTFADLNTKKKVLGVVMAPLLLMIVLGAISWSGISRIIATDIWVARSNVILDKADTLIGTTYKTMAGLQEYLLVGQEHLLAPYTTGIKDVHARIADLQKELRDSPDQVRRLKDAERSLRAWQRNVTEPLIQMRRKIGSATSMAELAARAGENKGKAYIVKFHKLMNALMAGEQQRMAKRRRDNVATVDFTKTLIVGGIIIAVAVGGGLAWLGGSVIAAPIVRMTETMGRLAQGDKNVDVPGVGRGDELGAMAGAVQVFKENMIKSDALEAAQKRDRDQRDQRMRNVEKLTGTFDQKVSGMLKTVSGAAEMMEESANAMSSTAVETSERSARVSSAAQQASANVQTVASASEELSSSITEISRQVVQSTGIASEAVSEVDAANVEVQGLAQAAHKIGEVVALITDIADQTNLLALNATIEAARAGEAGKGFAVVASEVKNLANQTAKATEEIANHVSGIQKATTGAVSAIGSIGGTIGKMNEIAFTIASAVEEQGAATQEISRNVEQAARGTEDVTLNISQVSRAAGETGQVAGQVLGASHDLAHQSVDLKNLIEQFLGDVRAA